MAPPSPSQVIITVSFDPLPSTSPCLPPQNRNGGAVPIFGGGGVVSWSPGWEVKSLKDATLLAFPSGEGPSPCSLPASCVAASGSWWQMGG